MPSRRWSTRSGRSRSTTNRPPIPAAGDDLASSLVLQALKRRARSRPPGRSTAPRSATIGRVATDEKVATDLRGAQPKQDLTPRSLLDKSFAILVTDKLGNPKTVTLRGVPAAKKLLNSMLLREPFAYTRVAYPDHPVSAGDTWQAKRFFPNPIGRLGLAVDVEYRMVGFEKIVMYPACASLCARPRTRRT